ncbi:MAG: DEAD/DEAH box helicase [Planctomycetota bacterium]
MDGERFDSVLRDALAPAHVAADPARARELEAWRVLLSTLQGDTGAIPAELLLAHVFEVTPDAGFAVRWAAVEAVLRRVAFRERDELRVATRPPGTDVFGLYTTRSPRAEPRPYSVHLRSVEPLRASCDCRDYLRNSLGLCKHVLAVLEDMARRPRRLERARCAGPAPLGGRARLGWCPVRPLTGPGDWLAQVFLTPGTGEVEEGGASLARRALAGLAWRGLASDWLTPVHDLHGELRWAVRATYAEQPRRRLALVEALREWALPGGRSPGDPRALPDPALLALLTREREGLLRRLELLEAAPALRRALRSFARPLYPYQRAGVERMLRQGRLLLADDMGLGKTVQAIAVCHALYRAGKVRRGLVIVPASLKAQWLREWKQFTDTPARVVDGRVEERLAAYRDPAPGFLIVNYALVRRDLEALRELDLDLVVLDEAQRIKNWATQTAGAVKRLRPTWRLVLTGTPMENRLDELASILDWVDDAALEPKWRLAPCHTLREEGARGAPLGARNLDTLRQRLAPCLLRRTRDEVLDQLPPRTDTALPVELSEAQRVAHDDLDQPIGKLAAIGRRRALTRPEFLRLMSLLTTQRVIANGMAQLQFQELWPTLSRQRPTPAVLAGLASPKLLALRDLVEQLAVTQRRKLVVFSQWRRMLSLAHWAVSDLLAEAGLRSAFFTGRESQRQRTRNVVDFHDDPEVCVLFATDAGGVGLNLQRAATCCVNLELPWNPAVLEQRIARIHRLGQTRPIDVYDLVAPDCIEERIAGAVSAKAALFQSVFDGSENEVLFEGSGAFLTQLCQGVVAREAPTDLDRDAQEQQLDALLDAADESRDVLPSGEAPDERVATEALPARGDPAPAVRQLFERVAVTRTAEGGLRLEAPPEVAEALAALLQGLAGLLTSQP